jgi:putative hemolysin
MLLDILLIAILILANGFFAAAEMAVVSARPARLQTLAEDGNPRANRTLRLRQNPAEFLATVQVGITLVGTLASAVGGAEAARRLAPQIAQLPLLEPYASQIALGFVVILIAYGSLLFGELVPKRLAIRNPEKLAIAVTRSFEIMAKVVQLPIRILMASADGVLRLFGPANVADQTTSPEEIEVLVRRSAAEGLILPLQERMIERVFDYADRSVRDEMTPRTEIIALEAGTSLNSALELAKEHGYSRFPIYRENLDHILGYVHIKDLIWSPPDTLLESITRQVVFIPEGASLPNAFTQLTRSGYQMGIVLDEYGGTEGLITLENMLEVIVGEIEDEHSPLAVLPEQHDQGIWEIAGQTAILDVAELLGVDFEPHGKYNTLAGFIMAELGRIPQEGESISWNDFCFTVEEMERMRIKRVCVRYLSSQEQFE